MAVSQVTAQSDLFNNIPTTMINAAATPAAPPQLNAQAPAKSAASAGDGVSQQQVLSKTRLSDLVREVDDAVQMDEDVEDLLLSLADDFISRILTGACSAAKHRHVQTVEVKDVQLWLERHYQIWVPGFGTDELKPYKRSSVTEAHKQRLALIRRALKKY